MLLGPNPDQRLVGLMGSRAQPLLEHPRAATSTHLHFWRRSPEQICSSFHGAKLKQIPKLRNKMNLISEWSKGDFCRITVSKVIQDKEKSPQGLCYGEDEGLGGL